MALVWGIRLASNRQQSKHSGTEVGRLLSVEASLAYIIKCFMNILPPPKKTKATLKYCHKEETCISVV